MTGTPEECVRWLFNQDKEKKFTIKEYRKNRSLNANSYCWVLLGKIADVIGSTKEEVYVDYIRHKGIFRIIRMDNKSVETFMKIWTEKGLGWVCEASESNKEGLTDVTAYYGTSSYNTKQMANFIDYVVQECKNLGIETKSEEEINALIAGWENE